LWQICLKTAYKLICLPNNAAIYTKWLPLKMIIRILHTCNEFHQVYLGFSES